MQKSTVKVWWLYLLVHFCLALNYNDSSKLKDIIIITAFVNCNVLIKQSNQSLVDVARYFISNVISDRFSLILEWCREISWWEECGTGSGVLKVWKVERRTVNLKPVQFPPILGPVLKEGHGICQSRFCEPENLISVSVCLTLKATNRKQPCCNYDTEKCQLWILLWSQKDLWAEVPGDRWGDMKLPWFRKFLWNVSGVHKGEEIRGCRRLLGQ